MLSSFRNFSKSPLGLVVLFLFFAVIALAFGLTDMTGMRSMATGGLGKNIVARVGSREVDEAELSDRVQLLLKQLRQQGQPITNEDFVKRGGVDQVLNEMLDSFAMEEFANKNGMVVSKQLIDGQIAALPGFQGPDGKFSQKAFEELLHQMGISPKQLRDDVSTTRYSSWLTIPTLAYNQVPDTLLEPYAALLLQRRKVTAAIFHEPALDTSSPPDDKALTAFYTAHRGSYMVPAQRVIRYAIVKKADIQAQSGATDAEIAQAYAQAGTRFAATEKRSAHGLVLGDQAEANRAAAEIKSGKSVSDAAKSRGLEATGFDALEKADFAQQSSPEIANAAFTAPEGGVIGPIKTALGWMVLKVEKIEKIPAKSLAQAHDELAREITDRKTAAALSNRRQFVDDAIAGGGTFDEVLSETKLPAAKIGPVAADGTNPDDPAAKPDPALADVVKAGFANEPGDDPALVSVGKDGDFAVVATERKIAAAPRPLASIHDRVLHDFFVDRQVSKMRKTATDIVAKVNAGTPLRDAVKGLPGVKVQDFDVKRSDVDMEHSPPAVVLSFRMAPKKAKFLQSPDGFIIVYLDSIEEHDAKDQPELIAQRRSQIAPLVGREQTQQFLVAIRKQVKVVRNETAINAYKASLSGGAR